jgi:hypothetical protein
MSLVLLYLRSFAREREIEDVAPGCATLRGTVGGSCREPPQPEAGSENVALRRILSR